MGRSRVTPGCRPDDATAAWHALTRRDNHSTGRLRHSGPDSAASQPDYAVKLRDLQHERWRC